MRQSAAEMLFAPLALVEIAGLTVAGLVVGLAGLSADDHSSVAILVYAALVVVSIADPLVVRYAVMPAMAKQQGASENPLGVRTNMAVIGYSVAMAGGLYALVAAVITGSGWLALPPGALGVYAWLAVWSYLRELPEVSSPH